jgi:hypothetical protein
MPIGYSWENQKERTFRKTKMQVDGQYQNGSERDRMGWYGLDRSGSG